MFVITKIFDKAGVFKPGEKIMQVHLNTENMVFAIETDLSLYQISKKV